MTPAPWTALMMVLAAHGFPIPAQAADVVSPTPPIRLQLPAATDIRVVPSAPSDQRAAPVSQPDIRMPPPATGELSLPIETDAQTARELDRLKAQAQWPIPAARREQPITRAQAATAAWTLGLVHLHGAGVAQDGLAARQWFERAQTLGEPLSAAGVAWCAIDGCGAPPDLHTARQAIARLRNVLPARASVLEWWLSGRSSEFAALQTVAPNPTATVEQHEWLVRAARAGDAQAKVELGIAQFAEHRPKQALELFRDASARSPAGAANARYVQNLIEGRGPDRSEGRLSQDLLDAARRVHRGVGVPVNYPEAIRLYRQADLLGHPEAARMLALIFSRPATDGGLDIAWMQQLAWTDLSGATPRSGSAVTGHLLQRDPTPLFDFLPPNWQTRVLKVRPR